MLVYHDFRGDIASQIGTHAREKSKQPRCARSQVHPAAALECGLGLRRVQESVTISTSASCGDGVVRGCPCGRCSGPRGSVRSLPPRSRAFIFQISSSASFLLNLGVFPPSPPGTGGETSWRSFCSCFLLWYSLRILSSPSRVRWMFFACAAAAGTTYVCTT